MLWVVTLQSVAKAVERLRVALIRPTVPGLVMLDGEPVVMRWGFHRPFNKSINNTRSDKLDGSMWRTAFSERRCLIPVSGFYEWSGAKGHKRTHLFTPTDGGLLKTADLIRGSVIVAVLRDHDAVALRPFNTSIREGSFCTPGE